MAHVKRESHFHKVQRDLLSTTQRTWVLQPFGTTALHFLGACRPPDPQTGRSLPNLFDVQDVIVCG